MRVLFIILFLLFIVQPVTAKAETSVICNSNDERFVMLLSDSEMDIPSKYQRFDIIDKDQYAIYGKSLGYGTLAVYSKSENELLLISLFAKRIYVKAKCEK